MSLKSGSSIASVWPANVGPASKRMMGRIERDLFRIGENWICICGGATKTPRSKRLLWAPRSCEHCSVLFWFVAYPKDLDSRGNAAREPSGENGGFTPRYRNPRLAKIMARVDWPVKAAVSLKTMTTTNYRFLTQ